MNLEIALLTLPALLSFQDHAEWRPGPSDIHQSVMDVEAIKTAARIRGDVTRGPSEPLATEDPAVSLSTSWRPITDEEMRASTGYYAPPGYRFHRSARTDLDRDGKDDLIEMVTNGREGGLRITYAANGKHRIIIPNENANWSNQAIVAAGPHAFMIQQPEANFFIVFQRGPSFRVRFFGD